MGISGFLKQTAAELAHLALAARSRLKAGGVVINNHTQNDFEIRRQVEALAPFFEFIHHDDLVAGKSAKSKPFCLLTFDDGKKVNHLAASELFRLGVPAVFYVVTDFIDSRKPLWFDLLMAVKAADPTILNRFALREPKKLRFQILRDRLAKAADALSITADLKDPKIGPMSWLEVKDLHARGFTIGAHTTEHAILTNETIEMAKADIASSMRRVSAAIETACRTFAFTNGNFSRELAIHAGQAGAQTVVTTEPVWVRGHNEPKLLLPRLQLHDQQAALEIRLKLAVAMFGFALKNPNGAGRRYIKRRFCQRFQPKDVW